MNTKSKLIGGILLISGCCIGAGMLALPILSGTAGFFPSLIIFTVCWLFMVATGLILLEVNLSFEGEVSMISMAKRTLGRGGEIFVWGVFLFLFYCLMVAYTAASGSLMIDALNENFNLGWHLNMGILIFALFFGFLLFLGIGALDWFNRILVLGLILSYLLLLFVGIPHIQFNLLKRSDWTQVTPVIPAAIISFGFHNLIPSLTHYFKRDEFSLKWSIALGSAIPLLIYILWEGLILGIVPVESFKGSVDEGLIATEALKNVAGLAWVADVAQIFAFFAILSSFLSVSLSFVDFLADGLTIKKSTFGKLTLILLVLLPSTLCSIIYPSIFLKALGLAGGFGAVTLFGILPVLMVWKERQKQQSHVLLPGGKPVLVAILVFALWVMALQF